MYVTLTHLCSPVRHHGVIDVNECVILHNSVVRLSMQWYKSEVPNLCGSSDKRNYQIISNI